MGAMQVPVCPAVRAPEHLILPAHPGLQKQGFRSDLPAPSLALSWGPATTHLHPAAPSHWDATLRGPDVGTDATTTDPLSRPAPQKGTSSPAEGISRFPLIRARLGSEGCGRSFPGPGLPARPGLRLRALPL